MKIMYTVADVIYGVPLSEAASYLIDDWKRIKDTRYTQTDDRTCGFKTHYSRTGPDTGWCGVHLDRFDELNEMPLTPQMAAWQPTPEQIRQAQDMVDRLDPALKERCRPIGLYITWSTFVQD